MKAIYILALLSLIFVWRGAAQIPPAAALQIIKAEDARRYDTTLDVLMRSPDSEVRKRAALAAGRIGDGRALALLAGLLEKDPDTSVRAMAAFAIGEVESVAGSEPILKVLADPAQPMSVVERAVEAAGKIAGAHAKDDAATKLAAAVLECLKAQSAMAMKRDPEVSRLALTAALRSRPQGADVLVAKFLDDPDARIRTDAANTLTRLRAKNANEALRRMLTSDTDGAARANAARALGAAEDKDARDLLVKAATSDPDLRVRISSIRALGSLKDATAAARLIERGNELIAPTQTGMRSGKESALPKNELLEIASALGRLLPGTTNEQAVILLNKLRMEDGFSSPETEIALAQIAPKEYVQMRFPDGFAYKEWHMATAYAQGIAEIAKSKDKALVQEAGENFTEYVTGMRTAVRPSYRAKMQLAMPELTTTLAALKPDNIDEILRGQLANDDIFIRAAAAAAIAERTATKENVDALGKAFNMSFIRDKQYNDATLATLDALAKLDKKAAAGSALMALNSPDHLVRKKAFEILDDKDLVKDMPGIPTMVDAAKEKHKDQVLPYTPAFGTKLGQVLNTDVDYRRALARKSGSVKAVLTTDKGTFTIVFAPEEAPLTVDNWIKLSRAGYFNGLEVHRVVPNFVMQDGDPRGDGNGGPGWSIRCEINTLPFDRGAVGMALSGKDTGGSQWFVAHSPQPHLDGGYTVFGHVDETGMKVVDNIERGDRILRVTIVGM